MINQMVNQMQIQSPTFTRSGDLLSVIGERNHTYRTLDQQRTEYAKWLVLKKASKAITKVAKSHQWNRAQCDMARLMIRQMTIGTTPAESAILAIRPVQGMTPKQHAKVTEVVAQRFATTCWMQRHVIKTATLPGMGDKEYRVHYMRAQQLFPAQR